MEFGRSERTALQAVVRSDIKKDIIAFANSGGGTVYVGVADDGTVLGVEKADACIRQISHLVKDSVMPNVTTFIHYERRDCDGRAVVAVCVEQGTRRPYYAVKKGLRPEGVYVRCGDVSVPASDEAIRQMIRDTDGDSFEAQRSMNQSLTFEIVKGEFSARNMAFSPRQMEFLKLVSGDGLYTNAGLLLSEQCPYTMKAAVFEGAGKSVFKTRQEFSGSLMEQLKAAEAYINFREQKDAGSYKVRYKARRDYPEEALQEALLNALIHRDYAFRADTLIRLYDDRVEIVSLGGLVPGLAPDDLSLGVSLGRNPHLAHVFYHLQLIEAYGMGVKKIMDAYAGEPMQPQITASRNAFRIILPNVNYMTEDVEVPLMVKETAAPSLTSDEAKILQLLSEKRRITRMEVQELLGVSQSTAGRILKTMADNGQIAPLGGGRTTRYELVKPES